jgi:hypothetical protein
METTVIFFSQVSLTMLVMGLALRWYGMPRLRKLPQNEALAIALFPGAIRYVGMTLLVPSVTGPGGTPAVEGAVGDLVCALLALAAILLNRSGSPLGRPAAWLYVVIGAADMFWTVIRGFQTDLWSHLGGVWTIGIAVFPAAGLGIAVTVILLVSPQRAEVRAPLKASAAA